MKDILLEVKDLYTHFFTEQGVVQAVNGVSFSIEHGKTLSLVGESGCGKTVTAFSIMRLVPSPPGKIVKGEVIYNNNNLLKVSKKNLKNFRGDEIGMVFQEPMTSLNPVFTIGSQIVEAVRLHKKVSYKEAKERTINVLKKVGISAAQRRFNNYPHQLSGGMRQRAMIAMALSCNPKLLIVDEPTTALDVTIQAQILDLLNSLQEQFNMSILMITHDLGVVAEVSHDVAVMYAGEIVEKGNVKDVFKYKLHPYTNCLLNSLPAYHLLEDEGMLYNIPGMVPDMKKEYSGCLFKVNNRCPVSKKICEEQKPELLEVNKNHWARCHFVGAL